LVTRASDDAVSRRMGVSRSVCSKISSTETTRGAGGAAASRRARVDGQSRRDGQAAMGDDEPTYGDRRRGLSSSASSAAGARCCNCGPGEGPSPSTDGEWFGTIATLLPPRAGAELFRLLPRDGLVRLAALDRRRGLRPGPAMSTERSGRAAVFAGGRVVVSDGHASASALNSTFLPDAPKEAFAAGPKMLRGSHRLSVDRWGRSASKGPQSRVPDR
jgi:hypothetical protein